MRARTAIEQAVLAVARRGDLLRGGARVADLRPGDDCDRDKRL